MEYGDRRNFPKIDLYWRGSYRASTTWAKTCKEAKERFLAKHDNLNADEVRATFDKRGQS